MKKNIIKNFLVTIIVVLFFVPNFGLAQETARPYILIVSNPDTSVGQIMTIQLILNTSDAGSINAISAELSYPQDMISFIGAGIGSSIIDPWLERPKSITPRTISLSGVITGGYSGSSGHITNLTFKVLNTGTIKISIPPPQLLLNDGKGTSVLSKSSDLKVLSSTASATSNNSTNTKETAGVFKDTDPPEIFTPIIARDPNIFNDNYFVSFLANDFGSGIDHYEISENGGTAIVAESPYKLVLQKRNSPVVVTAVDTAGNKRAEYAVWPEINSVWNWTVYNIIFLVLLLCSICVLYILFLPRLSRP